MAPTFIQLDGLIMFQRKMSIVLGVSPKNPPGVFTSANSGKQQNSTSMSRAITILEALIWLMNYLDC